MERLIAPVVGILMNFTELSGKEERTVKLTFIFFHFFRSQMQEKL